MNYDTNFSEKDSQIQIPIMLEYSMIQRLEKKVILL